MPDRILAPRATLAGMTVGFAMMAGGYWAARDGETFAPVLWPVVYGVTSALCLTLMIRPYRHLAVIVGTLAFIGVLARVAGVVSNLAAGVYPEPGRAVAGFGLLSIGAMAVLYVFNHGIVPWAAAQQVSRRFRRS